MPRYSSSRQKACQQCTIAKAKCDRKVNACSRCVQRGLKCEYVKPLITQSSVTKSIDSIESKPLNKQSGSLHSPEFTSPTSASLLNSTAYERLGTWRSSNSSHLDDYGHCAGSLYYNLPSEHTDKVSKPDSDTIDFRNLDLICPIDADAICCRWLNPYVPMPGQQVKTYPSKVVSFIYRVLKSYAAVAIRGHGLPPFVHPLQFASSSSSTPLSTCLNLAHVWDAPRANNGSVATEILLREMGKLYECHENFDEINMLAVFQAYLVYTMVLFFHSAETPTSLRQAMTNLQEIACKTSQQGLTCSADLHLQRPTWEAWIVTETKRRALYTTYMFDSLLSAQENLPTFLGVELTGLPAPGTQILWQAQDRREWERACTLHLAEWMDGYLRIDELWPTPINMTESEIAERQKRVDHWLENVDAFGTMLYTVTSQTHGC